MANVFYDNAKKNLWNGTVDLAADTIKVALVTSSYSPSLTADEFFDDVTNEVTGTGYTAGGATLSGQAVTADTVSHRGKFTANTFSGFHCRYWLTIAACNWGSSICFRYTSNR